MTSREPAARSRHKRGPKGAPERSAGTASARRLTTPDGGFNLDDAEQHLVNFIRDSAIDKHDETFFRTTRDLVTAARRWRKISNDRIKPVGQNMPRWETLYLVAYSGEELTQKELARLISVTGPTMVHMLDSLARDGLIERRHSTVDRRVTINSITDEGRRVVHDIMGVTNALRRELLDQIDPAKLAVALEVLGDIRKRLDEMQ